MALLQELTDELLVEIVRCSACNKTTLLNLATVNKKFSEIATQILAHDVSIDVNPQDQGE